MTFTEIEVACKGYRVRESRRKELDRVLTFMVNQFLGGGKTNLKTFYPLETDSQGEKMDAGDYEETLKMFGRELPTKEEKEQLLNWIKWQKDLKRNLG